MKCENVPNAVKKPAKLSAVLCTTPKSTFSRCRQMEDGGNYQFAHVQREKFCQFHFRLLSCVDTVLNHKVSIVSTKRQTKYKSTGTALYALKRMEISDRLRCPNVTAVA